MSVKLKKAALKSGKELDALLHKDHNKEREFNKNTLWYHGRTTNRKKAEQMLKGCKPRTFLVRDSFSSHGDFVLSVKLDGPLGQPLVRHRKITCNKNDIYYSFDNIKPPRETHGIEKFIEYFQTECRNPDFKLEKFIEHQPPPAHCRRTGRDNVLHQAIISQSPNTMNILNHANCPDINSKNAKGQTALHLACTANMLDVVELLIQKHVNLSSKNMEGLSAVHLACKLNRYEVLKLLLINGKASPVDSCKKTRISPIHVAAEMGHLDCVMLLLQYGSPDRPRDSEANIPAELARQHHQLDVVKYLESFQVKIPALIRRTDWYHQYIKRPKAEELFHRLGHTDGIFLIRNSSNANNYALTLGYEQKIYHYEIKVLENLVYYIHEGPLMTSLEAIVYHYARFADGLRCRLMTAVSTHESLMDLDIVPHSESEHHPDQVSDHLATGLQSLAVSSGMPNGDLEEEEEEDDLYDICEQVSAYVEPCDANNTNSTDELRKFIIDKKNLIVFKNQELGQGEFGSVLRGQYIKPTSRIKKKVKIDVAIKTLRDTSSNKESFLREARVMCRLRHDNIVELIGICEKPELMIVQELVKMGSMLDYLWDCADQIIPDQDLILWATQIANGMTYLESQKFVHRDLAARNILLESKTLAKISDFGLSRAVSQDSDAYEASQGGRWPVKWYAPECVNYGTFSSASDVWSYGVTLYEMYAFGEQPYGDLPGAQVISLLDRGERLEQPESCPDYVYEAMRRCWMADPKERPTFKELFDTFTLNPKCKRAASIIDQGRRKKKSRS